MEPHDEVYAIAPSLTPETLVRIIPRIHPERCGFLVMEDAFCDVIYQGNTFTLQYLDDVRFSVRHYFAPVTIN